MNSACGEEWAYWEPSTPMRTWFSEDFQVLQNPRENIQKIIIRVGLFSLEEDFVLLEEDFYFVGGGLFLVRGGLFISRTFYGQSRTFFR